MRFLPSLSFVALIAVGAPAAAQTQVQQQPTQVASANANAADQIICEKQEETGSRLASHKVCHTRSQWEQLRRDDKDATVHVQMQRSMSADGH